MKSSQLADYPGYLIREDGLIQSFKSDGRFGGLTELTQLVPFKNKKGYWCVNLYVDGKPYQRKVHRLVALAFIPNPLSLPQVNHKKGKDFNHKDELEWCTAKGNIKHACESGLRDNDCRKSTACFRDPEGNLHNVFGLGEFARKHNLSISCLSQMKNGKLSQHKGWTRA